MKLLPIFLVLALLSSCASDSSQPTAYQYILDQIHLGMWQPEFSNLTKSIKTQTSKYNRYKSEVFMRDNNHYQVIYLNIRDESGTKERDREYTPYLFLNSRLISYGWSDLTESGYGSLIADLADEKRKNLAQRKADQKISLKCSIDQCRDCPVQPGGLTYENISAHSDSTTPVYKAKWENTDLNIVSKLELYGHHTNTTLNLKKIKPARYFRPFAPFEGTIEWPKLSYKTSITGVCSINIESH